MHTNDSTARPVVWLTCADLRFGDVKGCQNHEPDQLGEHDCDCADYIRWSGSECARPEIRRIPESRFGLRLCCACAGRFELHVIREAGYAGNPHLFHRLPLAERQHFLRRAVARIAHELRYGQGYVGTWRPHHPERTRYWRTVIASERAEVAA